jgi:CheY-like chemotaxis protein
VSKLGVVVIDDEEDIRYAMQQVLTHLLPDMVDVSTFHPDDYDSIDWAGCQVAIIDLMMPGRDGESILSELATNWPNVYRVAWTAKYREARERLVDAGIANAAVAKPGFDEIISLFQARDAQ